MAEFFGWNPDRGTWYEHDYDPLTDKTIITTKQDVKPVLDHIQRKRDSGYVDRGIKKGWWHYATIPAWVEVELKAKGINIYKQGDTKRLLDEINTNYPFLKNTYKTHTVKE